MDTLKRSKTNSHAEHSHVAEAATEFLNESKKLANELYEDGLKKVGVAQKDVQAYADDLMGKVRENPLKSMLIAGGIGFLLSVLIKK